MTDMKLKREVLFVQHGKFQPDGSAVEVEYGSIWAVEPENEDSEVGFGFRPVKMKVHAEKRAAVLAQFRAAGGRGIYEVGVLVSGANVSVLSLSPVEGSGSQSKRG